MKIETALKYIEELKKRLSESNGVIATPTSSREATLFDRVWVFGSVVKGSNEPKDVDILYQCHAVGEFRMIGAIDGLIPDRNNGHIAESSRNRAIKILTKGMRMVRFHDYEIDGDYGDIKQTRQLIWENE